MAKKEAKPDKRPVKRPAKRRIILHYLNVFWPSMRNYINIFKSVKHKKPKEKEKIVIIED